MRRASRPRIRITDGGAMSTFARISAMCATTSSTGVMVLR